MSEVVHLAEDLSKRFFHGSKTVGTSVVQIVSSPLPILKGIQFKADDGNAGVIYIGRATVTAETDPDFDGYPLLAQEGLFVPIEDISLVHAIASQASQKLFWFAI